jgi:hypothetical protein
MVMMIIHLMKLFYYGLHLIFLSDQVITAQPNWLNYYMIEQELTN